MADELVTIRLRVTGNSREIDQTRRRLERLSAQSALTTAQLNNMGNTLNKKVDPEFRKFQKRLTSFTSALAGFQKLMLKVFGITFALAAASLAGVNALFATGRFLVKGYEVAMKGLAVAAAAVGAALATVAAAQREYNAALYAYAYKSSPNLGKGLNQSRAALRMLQTDTQLAVFGMEALNSAFATISASGQMSGGSIALLRALSDFAAAGGDPAKNFQAAADFVAMIQKEGKVTTQSLEQAKKSLPAFAAALKEASKQGITSTSQIMAALKSGQLGAIGGVTGQAGLLGQTLIGSLKGYVVQIRNLGADIGQSLLQPVNEALNKVFQTIRMTLMRIAPEIVRFGKGTMLDGLISGFNKIADFLVNLFRKWLPASNGMLAKFGKWWAQVVHVFDRAVNALRPLLDGGRAIIDMFGPAIGAIFGKFGDIIKTIDRLVVQNREQWNKFTTALTKAVNTIGDFLVYMLETFDRALPALTVIINAFIALANAIMGASQAIQGFGGGLGGVLPLMMLAGAMFAKPFMKGMMTGGAAGGRAGRVGNAMRGGRVGGAYGLITPPVVVGGAGASQKGPMGRAMNAFRGAGKGGASIGGRLSAARTGFGRAGGAGSLGRGFGGSIGPGLALGLLSGMVAPEASEGVGGGAMIASLAPLLGKAGPYAALAGTAVAGYSIMKNATTTGGGALGGAMMGLGGGALAGAAIGAAGGPIGMVGGALIGVAAGAIIGAVQGRAQGEQKKVMTEVGKQTDILYNSVANAMVIGNTDAARRYLRNAKSRASELAKINEQYFQGSFYDPTTGQVVNRHDRDQRKQTAEQLYGEGKLTRAEADAMINAPGTFAKEMAKAANQTEEFLDGPLNRFDEMTRILGKSTGMTTEEIMQLANKMGVNLYDDTLQFQDALSQLGLTMQLTTQQIVGGARDIALKSLSAFDEAYQALNAPDVLNEIVDNFRELALSDAAKEKDLVKFIGDYANQLMVMFPDDPIGATQELFDQFGEGGLMYQAGAAFAGLGSDFLDVIGPILTQLESTTRQDMGSYLGGLISQQLLGQNYAVDVNALSGGISRLPLQQQQAVLDAISSGTFQDVFANFAPGQLQSMGFGSGAEYITSLLGGLGITGTLGVERTQVSAADAAKMSEDEILARTQMFNAISTFFENEPNWLSKSPSWFSQFPGWWDPSNPPGPVGGDPDTTTPRGFGDTTSTRLGKTMRRYGYLNSMLTGKRTVTSAYRTNNLGSINSDHIMGRAFDLTGQNLGAFSTLVNNSGGFAEFHGRGGSRHLHVVPGETPVGDTSSVATRVAPAAPVGPTSNSYNIVINGGSDSADVIAKKVMAEINRQQRSKQERM